MKSSGKAGGLESVCRSRTKLAAKMLINNYFSDASRLTILSAQVAWSCLKSKPGARRSAMLVKIVDYAIENRWIRSTPENGRMKQK